MLISFRFMLQYYGECAIVSYFSGMPGNTIGQSLVLTTYGESHGSHIGGILDGMPAGIDKESEACVIDSKRRLDGVLQDLEAMVEEHGEALGDNEDLKAAKELLAANPPPEN